MIKNCYLAYVSKDPNLKNKHICCTCMKAYKGSFEITRHILIFEKPKKSFLCGLCEWTWQASTFDHDEKDLQKKVFSFMKTGMHHCHS